MFNSWKCYGLLSNYWIRCYIRSKLNWPFWMLSQIFIFLSMKQFFKLKCHMYTSNILNVGLSKTDNPAKSWTIEDPVSNYPDRCVPRKSFCNLFFVLFMKFTPQVSTPHRPVVCHIKCNCSKPEQPKIEADRSHFTLSLNISAVYYTPAVILLSLLSE